MGSKSSSGVYPKEVVPEKTTDAEGRRPVRSRVVEAGMVRPSRRMLVQKATALGTSAASVTVQVVAPPTPLAPGAPVVVGVPVVTATLAEPVEADGKQVAVT